MARPSAEIIMSTITPAGLLVDVLEVEKTYAVCLDGKPISVREDAGSTGQTNRYRRVYFANPAHAHRRAKQLNELFGTDRFKVVEF